MDLVMVGGFLAAFGLIYYGIMNGSGDIAKYYDFASILITVGGTLCAGLISYPYRQIKSMLRAVLKALRPVEYNLRGDIDLIIGIAYVARKDGLLALEEQVRSTEDPFLKKGVMLIADGTDPEMIRDIMETELDFTQARHAQSQAILGQLASYAPAFGMLGTLVGLINMLQKMDDLSVIGPNMATAIVTTLYGVMLANLVFTPLARKLAAISSQESLRKEILLEGILAIQDGENPRIIKDKLEAFLARSELGQRREGVYAGASETREL